MAEPEGDLRDTAGTRMVHAATTWQNSLWKLLEGQTEEQFRARCLLKTAPRLVNSASLAVDAMRRDEHGTGRTRVGVASPVVSG